MVTADASAGTRLHDTVYPMQFAARQGLKASTPHCPDCQVIVGQGVIVRGTARQWQTFLKRWGGDPARVVLRLHSAGGDVSASIRLGRAIRASGVQTEAISRRPCQSACAFAFAGGVKRAAQRNAIAVHDFVLGARARQLGQTSVLRSLVSASIGTHLERMGMDQTLLALATATPHHRLRKLSVDDLRKVGITPIERSN